jgi:hypothetical protein
MGDHIDTWWDELSGDLDELAIFDDVLTSTEINDIMDNGLKPVAVASIMNPRIIWVTR